MPEAKDKTEKRTEVLKATLTLVCNKGFHNTPMAQIAKRAGVSAGSIYLYFDNKQDLIDSLYLETKTSFTQAAFSGYDPADPVKEGFEKVWKNMAAYKMNHVPEALFLAQCDIAPIITEKVREKGLKHLAPLLKLWERGQKQGVLQKRSPYLLYAYAIHPLSFFAAVKDRNEIDIEESMVAHTFEMAWNAIKAKQA